MIKILHFLREFAYFSQRRLDDLPTFRYARSTVSLFSGTPARRFPYFPAHRLDDFPTFRNAGSAKIHVSQTFNRNAIFWVALGASAPLIIECQA